MSFHPSPSLFERVKKSPEEESDFITMGGKDELKVFGKRDLLKIGFIILTIDENSIIISISTGFV